MWDKTKEILSSNPRVLFNRIICTAFYLVGVYYSETTWQFIAMFFLFWIAWPEEPLHKEDD